MLKDDIINFFYNEHYSTKDIAKKTNVSSAYVTKVVKTDTRYTKEKEYRKTLAKDKRKVDQNKFAKHKREQQRLEDNYCFVKKQHIQDSIELSSSGHLTNEAYRKWNYSAYSYNPSKRQYEFDSKLGRSADVPKYIKER